MDIVLLLMVYFYQQNKLNIDWSRLELIWPEFLSRLRSCKLEVPGFYQDLGTRSYRDLHDAFFWLSGAGFGEYFLRDRHLYLTLSSKVARAIIEKSDPGEVKIIFKVAPKMLQCYNRTRYQPPAY